MKRSWLRVGLLNLASASLVVSLWALPFPRSFYDDFPLPGRAWIRGAVFPRCAACCRSTVREYSRLSWAP
ncbi:MAG: hypothetical protein LC704_09165 [Actinobacteria bacterium]|nr:hypothetical protein [Actinomycetota bacterium]